MADTRDTGTSTLMVALIAILVIIAVGFIALQVLPSANDVGSDIDADIDVPVMDDGMTDGGDGGLDVGE